MCTPLYINDIVSVSLLNISSQNDIIFFFEGHSKASMIWPLYFLSNMPITFLFSLSPIYLRLWLCWTTEHFLCVYFSIPAFLILKLSHVLEGELLNLVNNNTGGPLKFEFQIEYIQNTTSRILHGTHLHKSFIHCLSKTLI